MINIDRLKAQFLPHGPIYTFLGIVILCLTILTIVYASLYHHHNNNNSPSTQYSVDNGIIGFPIRLPNDGQYVQWTFLHLNDVYELVPLDNGQKGGLARVAYVRQLLKQENSNTYTILAGDLVSPSALSSSVVNGTKLNGRQMIATMNVLGLDYMTFGNHEFDLSESQLLARMNESTFTWISSNVFQENSSQLFGPSISYKILTIDTVRILFIGLTIDTNHPYVQIINQSSLVNYVQEFLTQFPNGTYDLLVAITHLDITTDIELVENILEIDLILGGHEHVDYYYLRGTKFTPIYKADANAFTAYIHRCAFNLNTRKFRIYSTLIQITSEVPEEPNTATVANYWWNLGMQGFEAMGFDPTKVVSCLPSNIQLDGTSEDIVAGPTLLTTYICESMVQLTAAYQTIIGIFNAGSVRLDDFLSGTIIQYDILRTLPFGDIVVALSVPGQILAQVLTNGIAAVGEDSFVAYSGVETLNGGQTWLFNGTDISTSGLYYKVATIAYYQQTTLLNNPNVTTLDNTNITQAQSLIDFLTIKYPPC